MYRRRQVVFISPKLLGMKITWAVWQCMRLRVGWGFLGVLTLAGSAIAQGHVVPTHVDERQIAQECAPLLDQAGARRALHMSKVLLQSQGMRLVVQACPFVRVGVGDMQQVLDVRVQISDSDTAAQFVRGPLADGEEVDMGDVHIEEPEPEDEVSPDVQFNRAWLAGVMQKRGLKPVGGHWWAFVPSAAAK